MVERKRRINIADVARAAGVSHSTASRALSDAPKVSPAARAAVLQAASDLGYVRDLRAADLASSHRGTVGLLIRGAQRAFYGELAAQIQRATEERDVDLLIVTAGDSAELQHKAIRALLGHGVAGILVASGRIDPSALVFATQFVPVVTLALGLKVADVDDISIAGESERALARQVVAQGHRSVAVSASKNEQAHTLHTRTANFLTELVVGGVDTTVIPVGDHGEEAFKDHLRQALDGGCTAVMAGDDPLAVRMLELFSEWGIDCPGQVSVTGFDGVGPFRTPLLGLTTVRQPVTELAATAVSLINARIEGSTEPLRAPAPSGELVIGRTLGPAPAAPS